MVPISYVLCSVNSMKMIIKIKHPFYGTIQSHAGLPRILLFHMVCALQFIPIGEIYVFTLHIVDVLFSITRDGLGSS